MEKRKRIAIIGGGNIGTLMAAEFSRRGNEVLIYTRDTSKWADTISVYNSDDDLLYTVNNIKTTDSLEEAVGKADVIWVTTPMNTFKTYAEKLVPIVSQEQYLCVVPGAGAEFDFIDVIKNGCTFVGLEKVHSIARVKEYGKSVYELGKKAQLSIGVIPASRKDSAAEMLRETIGIETKTLPNYLTETLTPVNAFLHPCRLYSMLHNAERNQSYDRIPLFYVEWDDESSQLILECDHELSILCRTIPVDLSEVVYLHQFYNSNTAEELTRTLQELPAFQKIKTPMYCEAEKYYIDWDSRYFVADFPYSLKLLVDIAKLFDVETPCMEKILNWYLNMNTEVERFELNVSKEVLLDIYK